MIEVKGPPTGTEVTILIDGAVLPAATVGLARRVNPGMHVFEVRAAGFATERREIDVKEKEARVEPVALRPATAASVAAGAPREDASSKRVAPSGGGSVPGTSGAVPVRSTAPATPAADKSVPVWVSAGASVAAAAVSVGFLVDHMDVRATVARECPNDTCDPTTHDQTSVDALRARWDRSLGISVAFGAVFLAGAGVAITGIVTTREKKSATGLALVPWAGPDGGGLLWKGDF